jgi:hypothetical protein
VHESLNVLGDVRKIRVQTVSQPIGVELIPMGVELIPIGVELIDAPAWPWRSTIAPSIRKPVKSPKNAKKKFICPPTPKPDR